MRVAGAWLLVGGLLGGGCIEIVRPNPCAETECRILGACVPAGTLFPEATCRICDPKREDRDWSLQLDGAACVSGDPCQAAECKGGTCLMAGAVDCSDSDACTDDSCDAMAGCVHALQACVDSSACTDTACDQTTGCLFGEVVCDDLDPCTVDACDVAVGCTATPAPCDDGLWCTADACAEADGRCMHTAANEAETCDDGVACTGGDTCLAGVCAGASTCDDLNACTTDSCDLATGACTFTVTPGVPCDDENWCTTGDTCAEDAACYGTYAPLEVCGGNPCTDKTCAEDGCTEIGLLATGTPCAPESHFCPNAAEAGVCTGAGVCQPVNPCDAQTQSVCEVAQCPDAEGTCPAPAPLGCNPDDPCVPDVCDPVSACESVLCDAEGPLLVGEEVLSYSRPAVALAADRRLVLAASKALATTPTLPIRIELWYYDLDLDPPLADLQPGSAAIIDIDGIAGAGQGADHELNPDLALFNQDQHVAVAYSQWANGTPEGCSVRAARAPVPAKGGTIIGPVVQTLLAGELTCPSAPSADAAPAPAVVAHPYGQPVIAYDGVSAGDPRITVVALPSGAGAWPEATAADAQLVVSHAWAEDPNPGARYEREPALAVVSDTRGVVAWESSYHPEDGQGSAIALRAFGIAIGEPATTLALSLIGDEDVTLANDVVQNGQQHPSLLVLESGRMALVWLGTTVPGSLQAEVRVREFWTAPLAPVGASYVAQPAVSPYPVRAALTQTWPGQFAMATEHAAAPTGPHAEVRYTVLSVGGQAPAWSVMVSGTAAVEEHRYPAVACQVSGFCAVAWQTWYDAGTVTHWAVRLRRW